MEDMPPISSVSSRVSSGSSSADVRALQLALAQKGFDPQGSDGQFGAKTRKALMAFQAANGLKPDGVVGPKTSAALFGTAPTPARPAAPKGTGYSEVDSFTPGKGIGSGEPSIDLNGTKYTAVEGRAADNNISIHLLKSRKDFDPLKDPGVALTNSQAKALGVKVGDKVLVHDRATGKDVVADYYDNAGTKPDGLRHMEMDPALADQLGVSYRNKKGKVIDSVVGSENIKGRFEIRPYIRP